MRVSTLIGIILGTLAIFGAFVLEGGSVVTLLMWPALIIVLGGTLAAGLASSTVPKMLSIPRLILLTFNPPKYDLKEIIHQIVQFAYISRREGILSLERNLENCKHPFMKKLFESMIDGADPNNLESIAKLEMNFIAERHYSNINLFQKLGGYSPTMGIIGTVMGLISTLAAAGGNPTELIQHISTAFIATLWGIFMANIVWFPIGDKLKMLHDEEIQLLEIMLQGVLSVQIGEVPTVVYSKLISAFPLSEQEKMGKVPKKFIEEKPVGENPFLPKDEIQTLSPEMGK